MAWLVVGLLGLALLASPALVAQDVKKDDKKDDKKPGDAKPPEVTKVPWTRTTDDGVKIVGDFYPGSKPGKSAPVVVLMHAIGRSSAKRQDFERFPEKLAEKGYAVITFDWRGYGDSTGSTEVVPDTYWKPTFQRPLPAGFKANDPPTKISAKDWKKWNDLLWLPNDLICVKKEIVTRNNAMECNSANICLIGVEDGALMGFLWLTQEYTNPDRWKTLRTETSPPKTEGEDVSCCVWLSMPNALTPASPPKKNLEKVLREWMEYPHRRDRSSPQYQMYLYYPIVKTCALCGKNDKDVADFWNRAIKWLKPNPKDKSMEHTKWEVVKDTSLAGAKLLGNESFESDTFILKYLEDNVPKGTAWRQQIEPDRLEPKLFRVNGLGIN